MPVKKDYLTEEEKTLLPVLLAEAKGRGLLPNVQRIVSKEKRRVIRPFPKDENGFYFKYNGTRFKPNNIEQVKFIKSNAYFCAYVGGRGSGKSSGAAQKVIPKIEAGEPGIVINPDFENFKISTWPEFREWLPWERVIPRHQFRRHPEWSPNGPFYIVFDTGAWVLCKGVQNPDSARGPNVNWMWYDEAGKDRDGMAWRIAVASVRISLTGMPTQRIVSTTPNYLAPWLEDLFHNKNIPKEALEAFESLKLDIPIVEEFHGSLHDNRENLDPATYATLLSTYPPGWLREQEIMGMYVTPSGVLGNPAWFDNHIVETVPDGIEKRVRYWDLAGSERKLAKKKALDPDSNVGTLLSQKGDNFFIEEQTVAYRIPWDKFKELVRDTAIRDGPYVPIYIEQEGASGGINQVEEFKIYIRDNVGPQWTVKEHKPLGDKIQRALPWFAEAAKGLFYIVKGTWNQPFFDQLRIFFTEGAHDDHIDSLSGARQIIAPFKTWKNVEFISLASDFDEDEKETKVDDIIGL